MDINIYYRDLQFSEVFQEEDSYLSYQISLALWVYVIDVASFSVVISSHAVANLMSEGVVTDGKVLFTEADLSVMPWEVHGPSVPWSIGQEKSHISGVPQNGGGPIIILHLPECLEHLTIGAAFDLIDTCFLTAEFLGS